MQAFDPPFEMDAGVDSEFSDFDEPLPVGRKTDGKIMHSHEGAGCCGRYDYLTSEASVKVKQSTLSLYDDAVIPLISMPIIQLLKSICVQKSTKILMNVASFKEFGVLSPLICNLLCLPLHPTTVGTQVARVVCFLAQEVVSGAL